MLFKHHTSGFASTLRRKRDLHEHELRAHFIVHPIALAAKKIRQKINSEPNSNKSTNLYVQLFETVSIPCNKKLSTILRESTLSRL